MSDFIKPAKEQADRAGLALCQARGLDPSAAMDGDWGRPITNLEWYRSETYPALVVMLNKDSILAANFSADDEL